jgi:hypothetical protein
MMMSGLHSSPSMVEEEFDFFTYFTLHRFGHLLSLHV